MKIDTNKIPWKFFKHKKKTYLINDESDTLYQIYDSENKELVNFPKSECTLLKKIDKQFVLDEYNNSIAGLEDLIERYKTAIKELDSI